MPGLAFSPSVGGEPQLVCYLLSLIQGTASRLQLLPCMGVPYSVPGFSSRQVKLQIDMGPFVVYVAADSASGDAIAEEMCLWLQTTRDPPSRIEGDTNKSQTGARFVAISARTGWYLVSTQQVRPIRYIENSHDQGFCKIHCRKDISFELPPSKGTEQYTDSVSFEGFCMYVALPGHFIIKYDVVWERLW